MKRFNAPAIWGLLLIVAGLLILLQNIGVMGVLLGFVWAGLFAAAGLVFVYVYLTKPESWWAIIPGFSLLGIGSLITMGELFPRIADVVGGAIFLGAIALSFWAVYLRNREMWWAIIPGGVLTSVALVTVVDGLNVGWDVGSLVLLGIGCTFLLVSTVRVDGHRMRWALIPATIMLIIGFMVMAESVSMLGYIWPVGLILAGFYLMLRYMLRTAKSEGRA